MPACCLLVQQALIFSEMSDSSGTTGANVHGAGDHDAALCSIVQMQKMTGTGGVLYTAYLREQEYI